MFIDTYKKDGYYVDKHGGQYEDAEGFIETGIFGFCGCGQPSETREYVRKALQLVKDLKEKVWENLMTYDDWHKQKQDLFKTDEAEMFMWYWLDNKAFIEHGSAVPGWLTNDGEEILSDLNELLKYEK